MLWILWLLHPRRPTPAEEMRRRLDHLDLAWAKAWARNEMPGLWHARPYPQLGDEAARVRKEELLRHIEAEMED